jgi:KipI family sensor histidine kinase inhibitor
MGKLQMYRLSERSVTVSWEPVISPEIHQQVLQADKQVHAGSFPGWIENVPAYHTLTVYFDPQGCPPDPGRYLLELISAAGPSGLSKGRALRVPVIYNEAVAPDLGIAAEKLGLTVPELIRLHTSQLYHVYMLGFMPGFPYMGELPEPLRLPRKAVPTARVAAGTVAIAGHQTGIYPYDSPGGWYAIGKTAISLFDQGKAYFEPGDEVEFYQVI